MASIKQFNIEIKRKKMRVAKILGFIRSRVMRSAAINVEAVRELQKKLIDTVNGLDMLQRQKDVRRNRVLRK